MALTLWPVPGKEKSRLICKAFAAGAPKSATGAVFFGTEGVMQQFQKAKLGTWYYIDNAYFDKHRGTYFRVTKNDLQVNPTGKASDGSRFAKLGIEIKPWRLGVEPRILVCPQSDDFMKSTLGRKGDWTRETVEKLTAWGYGGEVVVRPWQRDKAKAYASLHEDLKHARLVVTWSSASAITALLEGVPAISESGAAHAITGPLSQDSVAVPPQPDGRLRFAQVLADNQFTLEEFRDGTAWKWLHRT